ncbi:hypothetical protein A2721_01835 [Candidatus Gottesmanbacteria bacterium RIFCSPHIGHO2_01_FULL_47_48]|uniref:Four helix bundle protein n=1 Tax=Candidatus Gottesmanbacteria bacterium RIFCSPHIGHO2_01_FULL_47_48 TaxID=1798381 RepID=A0A1F6A1H4_9BACT|nr:MAG: hypothetical protein A2721_01835 [Candidatus Gottesmanbacteria bacterium RIFCSPHIGHO2_01_FULL_47_48]
MKVTSYKDLIVWQKSIELVVLIYRFTADFPKDELYGLTSQMRRCAVSIPSNIAEGWARKGTGEYINSLSVSDGSAAELDTQLIISQRLMCGEGKLREQCQNLLVEVQKMLPKLIGSLQNRGY